jgi:hypothetical protein
LENKKTGFWFQGGVENFLDHAAGAPRPRGQGSLMSLPFVSYLRARRTARTSLCFCFAQRAFSACERFSNCGLLGRDGLVEEAQRVLIGSSGFSS